MKTQDAIEWIQRRLYEFYLSLDDNNQEDVTFGNITNLVQALGLPVSGEEKKSFDLESNLHLCSSAISNGVSNISFHVWNKKVHSFTLPSETSRNSQAMHNSRSGVFVKVALPFVRWSRNHKLRCNPNRLHREYLALERVRAVFPHAAPRPFLYGKDEVRNDNSSYLIMEYISEPYRESNVETLPISEAVQAITKCNSHIMFLCISLYVCGYDVPCLFCVFEEYYTHQLNEGVIDASNIRYLGHILAKIHCVLPPMFGGKTAMLDKSSLEFISVAHYQKLRSDVEHYFKHSYFTHPVTGKKYPFSEKAAEEIKAKPEILRAISSHLTNFTDPPPETGTFIHLDFHTLNIFTRKTSVDRTKDQILDNSNTPILIDWKICDMEFSNWGPAGADGKLFNMFSPFRS